MPTAKEFAYAVEDLALTITGYQNGKSGQKGLCDCIGLIMGAMASLGHGSYPMHSTNYFARYQMSGLRTLKNGETLQVGQLLYKHNEDQSDLNDRYKAGGRYYVNGDLRNYYHIGVITDLNPLEITHCTQSGNISGIKRDSSTKGWTLVGELMGVDYELANYDEGWREPVVSRTAYVDVPPGTTTANMRKRPDIESEFIKRVPAGVAVDVFEEADGWAKIADPDGVKGYMMTKFLHFLEYATDDTSEPPDVSNEAASDGANEVTITISKEAARALVKALAEVVF